MFSKPIFEIPQIDRKVFENISKYVQKYNKPTQFKFLKLAKDLVSSVPYFFSVPKISPRKTPETWKPFKVFPNRSHKTSQFVFFSVKSSDGETITSLQNYLPQATRNQLKSKGTVRPNKSFG